MKVGDLVKYRRCGTHGVIIYIWESQSPAELMLEVLWMDGAISDTLSRRVEVINEEQ